MKSAITVFTLLLFSSILYSQDPTFSVSFEQGRKGISPTDDNINLQKAPFDIILKFSEPMGLLVGAYFTPEDYEMAKNGTPKADIPSFQGGGMAEDIFNEKKLIMVASDAVNYWYYQTEDDHRFDDAIKNDDGSIDCYRRIENIDDIYGEWTSIRDIDKPLYLVFISYKYDADYNEIELQREWLKLNFE